MAGHKKIRIGSRGSVLARILAEEVKRGISEKFDYLLEDIEIVIIKTSGDVLADIDLFELGGKGLFVKEIENALIEEKIDIAVHAMKDIPDRIPDSLKIAAVLKREDPRDILLSPDGINLNELEENAVIGTCSPRRKVQLLRLKPNLEMKLFRGNIDTRIRKLMDGEVDATMLALAGIKRAKISNIKYQILAIEEMIPAIGQAAIAIQIRSEDKYISKIVDKINHKQSFYEINIERIFLQALEADCRKPVAAYARMINEQKIEFNYLVADKNYKKIYKEKLVLDAKSVEQEISDLAQELRKDIFAD